MSMHTTAYVDHAEIKAGQILTVVLAASAILLQDTRLLMILAITFLLSGTLRPLSPFSILYQVIKPIGIIKSDYRLDNIQPHKFGQLIGAFTVLIALGLLHLGYLTAGWSIVVVLVLLTVVSYAGWCVGCFMYYQLNRLGVKGFFKHAPTDTSIVMGARPRKDLTDLEP